MKLPGESLSVCPWKFQLVEYIGGFVLVFIIVDCEMFMIIYFNLLDVVIYLSIFYLIERISLSLIGMIKYKCKEVYELPMTDLKQRNNVCSKLCVAFLASDTC